MSTSRPDAPSTDAPSPTHPKKAADASTPALDRMAGRIDDALKELEGATALARSRLQTEVFQVAEAMLAREGGAKLLYRFAPRFESSGVFAGGPWEDASKLQPALVAGSLQAQGVYPVVESMSELRMLAIATGEGHSVSVTAAEAREFLGEVLALNLEMLFPSATEEERLESGPHYDANLRLFALMAARLDLSGLRGDVIDEIDAVCAQRPLLTQRVRRMIGTAERIPRAGANDEEEKRLTKYVRALRGPSDLAMEHQAPAAYRKALRTLDEEALGHEAAAFAHSLKATGLAAPQHAVLLRHLRVAAPALIPRALGLSDFGVAHFEERQETVLDLLHVSVYPATAWTLYGIMRLLERGLLRREEIAGGLRKLVDLGLVAEVKSRLLAQRSASDAVSANSILVAGTMAVIGHPLGVGQGRNPTCQGARGISLWAEHAPGYLLQLLVSAARDGRIEMSFEGKRLETDKLAPGLLAQLHTELDPVQLVLVPHLDRLYDAMMREVTLRHDDGHKWVNPALYGRWVPNGFCSVFADRAQTTVTEHEVFVRRFVATHHPAFNDGHLMMYPNPVGICVTNGHGSYLGPHAISLLRVAEDPAGELRAYFFNPNNEGRQDWGRGVEPSVQHFGEREGESSLPFGQFVSRLYAYHYNPYEEGDAYAVPSSMVETISDAARETWGQSFIWTS